MIRRLARLVVCSSFASSLVLTNSSCASLAAGAGRQEQAALASTPAPKQRLVQFFFGRDAAFGVCAEPACPAVTRKTLAISDPAPVRPVVHRPPPDDDVPSVVTVSATSPAPTPSPSAAVPPARPVSVPPDFATKHIFVQFPFGSAELTAEARASLADAMPSALNAERIVISGRTDSIGNQKVNDTIAFARAMAVRDFFREQAPDLPNIIAINAKGACCFIASNQSEGGRAKNRRVEIVFTARGGA